MVTFANAAAAGEASWCVLVRIEGIGDSTGQWVFCSQVPNYAGVNYKPWLLGWPVLMSERADIIGGLPEAGAVDFEILDFGDALTALLGMDEDATTLLFSPDMDATTTTATVVSGTGIANGAILFVGNEAMTVTAGGGTGTLTVTRGALGTTATKHPQGSLVSLALPYLRSRIVQVHLVPKDGDSSSEERLFGQFSIDRMQMSEDLNSYRLSAQSELKHLSRAVPRAPQSWRLMSIGSDGNHYVLSAIAPTGYNSIPYLNWGDDTFNGIGVPDAWLLVADKELIVTPAGGTISFERREKLYTKRVAVDQGTTVKLVFVADNQSDNGALASSFRWSQGPFFGGTISTNRADTTWTKTSHPIDILLILLTSAYDASDGLELQNYDATYGNWSSLPVGYGAGLPISLIDVPSFIAIRQRFQNWSIPNFYFGDHSQPIAKTITDEILRPFGLFLSINNGKFMLVRPQPPIKGLTAAASITLAANIQRSDMHGAAALAKMGFEYAGDSLISTIVYKTRGRDGGEVSTIVQNGDLSLANGAQRGYYAHDESAIEISFAARADAFGFSQLAYELAEARLYLNQRPAFRVPFECDISLYVLKPGDLVSLTIPQVPDFRRGARDWTNRGAIVLERAIKVDRDGGARMALSVLAYADARMGLIGPSAVVSSVASNTATCVANRYTSATNIVGWPTTDVAAFAVGDVVRLVNLDLSSAASMTQVVQSIGTNTITLDGNFGGALAAAKIIRYASRGPSTDEVTATQAASFVFAASDATMHIGASTDAPWRWSAP